MAKKKIYEALVDGASAGLVDTALFAYVEQRCPQVNSRKLVRASLLALTDPHLADRNILQTIYTLAIRKRLEELGTAASGAAEDPRREKTPVPAAGHGTHPA